MAGRVVTRPGARLAVIAVVLLGGAMAAAFGPRFTRATSRAAGAPFSYTPPPEFNSADPEQLAEIQATAPSIRGAWVVANTPPGLTKPSVSLLHAPRMAGVEMSELDAIADGMPALLAGSGATWRTERVSRESRGDGTSVGWIEGACSKGDVGYHSLELVFPDDDGTSFVTATLPDPISGSTGSSSTEAKLETWDAEFLGTVRSATGVALRIGAPPWWMRAGWGAGVALLLLLASNIVDRRKSRVPLGASIPAPPMPLYERTDASEP